MQDLIQKVEQDYIKKAIPAVKSGDTVKVTQKIQEGGKERLQVFEGLVINTRRMGSHTATVTVRRIASGIGVEKTILLHSPLVTKLEIVKRSKVRRSYLTYMRDRSGKSARLDNIGFDSDSVNVEEEVEESLVADEPAKDAPKDDASSEAKDSKSDDAAADASAKDTESDQKPAKEEVAAKSDSKPADK